jgi:hypothetical protein
MFLPMLTGNCRGCTVYKDRLTTYRRYILCGRLERRKVEVERGRQVDVSAYVGRELQRLYKDRLTTYRRYTLWEA